MDRSTSEIQAFQLKSAEMSDVLGCGILNVRHVSVVQHKAIHFLHFQYFIAAKHSQYAKVMVKICKTSIFYGCRALVKTHSTGQHL